MGKYGKKHLLVVAIAGALAVHGFNAPRAEAVAPAIAAVAGAVTAAVNWLATPAGIGVTNAIGIASAVGGIAMIVLLPTNAQAKDGKDTPVFTLSPEFAAKFAEAKNRGENEIYVKTCRVPEGIVAYPPSAYYKVCPDGSTPQEQFVKVN